MRYKETREQTAELLRMVLPQMARHTAGFHPMTYAVWYEYLAGINPQLKRRGRCAHRRMRQSDRQRYLRLYETAIWPSRDAQTSADVSAKLARLVAAGRRRRHRGRRARCATTAPSSTAIASSCRSDIDQRAAR